MAGLANKENPGSGERLAGEMNLLAPGPSLARANRPANENLWIPRLPQIQSRPDRFVRLVLRFQIQSQMA